MVDQIWCEESDKLQVRNKNKKEPAIYRGSSLVCAEISAHFKIKFVLSQNRNSMVI